MPASRSRRFHTGTPANRFSLPGVGPSESPPSSRPAPAASGVPKIEVVVQQPAPPAPQVIVLITHPSSTSELLAALSAAGVPSSSVVGAYSTGSTTGSAS